MSALPAAPPVDVHAVREPRGAALASWGSWTLYGLGAVTAGTVQAIAPGTWPLVVIAASAVTAAVQRGVSSYRRRRGQPGVRDAMSAAGRPAGSPCSDPASARARFDDQRLHADRQGQAPSRAAGTTAIPSGRR